MTGTLHNLFSGSYSSIQTATIASNTSNVNAAALFPSTRAGVTYQITINSGVWVYSTSTGTPALDLSSFAAGAVISVINNGNIAGMGGAGGNGGQDSQSAGFSYSDGDAGSAGGDAIKLGTNDVSVDNTNGNVFGGGGGGGGGGGASNVTNDKTSSFYSGAGGGGGGGCFGDGGVFHGHTSIASKGNVGAAPSMAPART